MQIHFEILLPKKMSVEKHHKQTDLFLSRYNDPACWNGSKMGKVSPKLYFECENGEEFVGLVQRMGLHESIKRDIIKLDKSLLVEYSCERRDIFDPSWRDGYIPIVEFLNFAEARWAGARKKYCTSEMCRRIGVIHPSYWQKISGMPGFYLGLDSRSELKFVSKYADLGKVAMHLYLHTKLFSGPGKLILRGEELLCQPCSAEEAKVFHEEIIKSGVMWDESVVPKEEKKPAAADPVLILADMMGKCCVM